MDKYSHHGIELGTENEKKLVPKKFHGISGSEKHPEYTIGTKKRSK